MNQRKIKFQFWHVEQQAMFQPEQVTVHHDGVTLWRDNAIEPECNAKGRLRQYIGLKDNNGQEIYEGDIMQSPDWGCVAIRWLPDLGCFGCWHPTTGIHDNLIGYSEAQVIGNIYQNPELLQSND